MASTDQIPSVYLPHCAQCGYPVDGLERCPECGLVKRPYHTGRTGESLDTYLAHLYAYCLYIQQGFACVCIALVMYALWMWMDTHPLIAAPVMMLAMLSASLCFGRAMLRVRFLDMSRTYMYGGGVMCVLGSILFACTLCTLPHNDNTDQWISLTVAGFAFAGGLCLMIGVWMLAETGKMQLALFSRPRRFKLVCRRMVWLYVVLVIGILPPLGWCGLILPGTPFLALTIVLAWVVMHFVKMETASLKGAREAVPARSSSTPHAAHDPNTIANIEAPPDYAKH
ncbi:MAG: hypothetical protein H6815_04800 [Phycisphaeraceae bacterium]|nr:hypothetical protein [Phycisphaerales bacterium]MCB9859753.1 hypothetical protein [Phycisphaeraceae bacterium]